MDCPNGEDESSECERRFGSCERNQFACKNGECISLESHCNSRYDCKDRSDEENCTPVKCTSGKTHLLQIIYNIFIYNNRTS